MKTIGITLALALVLSVAPVMAEESFKGMQSLSTTVEALSDAELAKVEGGQIEINLTQINALKQTANSTAISAALAGEGGTATSDDANALSLHEAPTLTNTATITATVTPAAPPPAL